MLKKAFWWINPKKRLTLVHSLKKRLFKMCRGFQKSSTIADIFCIREQQKDNFHSESRSFFLKYLPLFHSTTVKPRRFETKKSFRGKECDWFSEQCNDSCNLFLFRLKSEECGKLMDDLNIQPFVRICVRKTICSKPVVVVINRWNNRKRGLTLNNCHI